MIFLSEFSLLSLGHLANSKQGEQYKNYKLSAYIQTFQKNGKKVLKLQFENSGLLSISQSCEASCRNMIGENFSINKLLSNINK